MITTFSKSYSINRIQDHLLQIKNNQAFVISALMNPIQKISVKLTMILKNKLM